MKLQNKFNIFRFFIEKYRFHTILVFLIQLGTGLIEGLGIAALLPLISTIIEHDAHSDSLLYETISNLFLALGISLTLENTLIVIVTLFFIKAMLRYLSAMYTAHMAYKVVYDFRKDLMDGLLKSRWRYFVETPTGHFTNALLVECQKSGGCFKSMTDIGGALLQIIILMMISMLASWKLVVIAGFTSVILWIALYRFISISGQTGLELKDASKKVSASITDTLQNIKPLKAMHLESRIFEKINIDIFALFKIAKRQMLAKQGMDIIHEPLFITIMCAGLYVSVAYINMETSVLMVMAAVFYRFIVSWKTLQQAYQVLSSQQNFFWSLQESISRTRDEKEIYDKGIEHKLEESLIFQNVSFSYGQTLVLSDLNLEIPARKLIGLYGPSGSGKTTIIDLICKLYTPQKGKIFVDGKSLEKIDLYFWRSSIGYVPQEFVIFNDTLKQNITLGDESISDEQVIEALKKSESWDFVSALPEGLDTNLGERGGRLSGGQRQRISIARALVRHPSILIMDEATASLDPKTEIDIFDTLKKLSKSMTIVAISHQNTIHEKADIVIDLSEYIKP